MGFAEKKANFARFEDKNLVSALVGLVIQKPPMSCKVIKYDLLN